MSFDIALSGIQAINEQLNTTSNNIANSGTYGFKSSRANFAATYAGARAMGTEVNSLTQSINLGGSVVGTGRGLDAAIDGRGFFVSRDAQNVTSYSRVGIFTAGASGYLTDSFGNNVQGYAAIKDSSALGTLGDMKVPTGQIPAIATTSVAYTSNMSSDWTAMPTVPGFDKSDAKTFNDSRVSQLFDSLGSKHTLTQYFEKTGTGAITIHYDMDGATLPKTTKLTYDTSGQLATIDGAAPTNPPGTPVPANYKAVFAPVALTTTITGANALAFGIDYTNSTQYAGDSSPSINKPNGNTAGTYTGVELAKDGSLVANYSNGEKQNVGTIALATFADEGSLTTVNNTSWIVSAKSGSPMYDRPGAGMVGSLTTSSLEGSNVDITTELVGLMTSQRNYQANSKVISTESAMLQSLMQAL